MSSLLLPLLLTVAEPLLGQGPGRTTRRGRYFILECKFVDDLFADDAMLVLDQVFALGERALKPAARLVARVRAKRLKVFIYDQRSAYEKVTIKHRQGDFAKFQGFADGPTRSCHLLKADALWWTRADMDPANRHMIAHEAMHLVVMEFAANHGMFLPMWVAEGIPIWAEGEVMIAGGWTASRLADVEEAGGLLAAQQMVQAKRFPSVEDLVDSRWETITAREAYHPIRMLWTYLAEQHPDAVGKLIEDVRATPASAAVPSILRSRLRAHLGDKVFAGLDTALPAFVAARKCDAHKSVRPLPDDTIGKPGDPGFVPGSPAIRWLGSSTRESYSLTARLTIRSTGAGQADLLFGRVGDRWLRVSMVPGAGAFLLRRTDQGNTVGPWKVVEVNRDVPGLVADQKLLLRLWVRHTKIGFTLAGKTVLDVELGDPLVGKWGVGGPARSEALWGDVRFR
jgi:hypothetical protein